MENQKQKGVLSYFNHARGFGYVRQFQVDAEPKFFWLHASAIVFGLPQVGSEVRFDEEPSTKKYPLAVNAEIIPNFTGGTNVLAGKGDEVS